MVSTEFSTEQYTCVIQNHRQKVFNRGALQFCGGALRLCGGVDIIKLSKIPLIYSVSRFNLVGLGVLFGEG